ncbi:transaldolase family protein [Streptomyces mirabilis]|uniref:transaldolase family protein n=1 Tax=Streptomyces mirabilis TaxID=68239 RepID=UPI003F4BEE67
MTRSSIQQGRPALTPAGPSHRRQRPCARKAITPDASAAGTCDCPTRPATREGLAAINTVIGRGISVNVTLVFSLERYRAVQDACLTGLEEARAAGHDLADIHSVASFFVSRVDAEVDARLTALGAPDALARSRRRPARPAGRSWRRPARVRGGPCGRRPESRTPTIPTPCT